MKKQLLFLGFVAGVLGFSSANAQLPEGSVFPDFTLTDINGVSHHLYDDLNSGKTVFIDISATWCNPCWQYHESGALDQLWAQHGPSGATGVNTNTTNDVVVYFFQGEPTSNLAELYGEIGVNGCTQGSASVEQPYATTTQGNWVTGSDYYFIDDTTSSVTSQMDQAWDITYFPTVYMICRDHLVHVMQQPTADEAYTAAQGTCPSTAPSSTADAKVTGYEGNSYFICNASPSLSFQNYSVNPVTAATLTVTDATGNTVATVPWTGSLAPYDIAYVSVPSFAATTFGGYKYSVSVSGDTDPSNNASKDSLFKVYAASNAMTPPVYEDFSTFNNIYEYDFGTDGSAGLYLLDEPGAFNGVTPDGTLDPNAAGVLFDFVDATIGATSGGQYEYVFGSYNTQGINNLTLSFDEAYAGLTGVGDQLEVLVSNDCGSTWQTAWSATGADLATAPVNSQTYFAPTSASQWKQVNVNLANYEGTNTMIKFKGISGGLATGGNFLWMDDFRLSSTTAVPNVEAAEKIVLYPNPASDVAYLNIITNSAANAHVEVIDELGRTLSTISQGLTSGNQLITIPTSDLATGIYNVKITIGDNITTKQLSVIK